MSASAAWGDLLLRLALSLVAGALVGLNRTERGKPAGLRTTILVCLAAALAMVLANLLTAAAGKPPDPAIRIDTMRLPLGILTGMGFIGGGAILRRQDLIVGVTTAATLWFSTVIGLCLGAGELWLGAFGTAAGLFVLWGLGYAERRLPRDLHARLVLAAVGDAAAERELIARLRRGGYDVCGHAVTFSDRGNSRETCFDLRWRAPQEEVAPPDFLSDVAHCEGVASLRWEALSV